MRTFYVVEKVADGDGGHAFVAHTPQLNYKDSQASAVGCGDSLEVAVERLRQHAQEALLWGNKPSGCHVDYEAFCKHEDDQEVLQDIVSWGHIGISASSQ